MDGWMDEKVGLDGREVSRDKRGGSDFYEQRWKLKRAVTALHTGIGLVDQNQHFRRVQKCFGPGLGL